MQLNYASVLSEKTGHWRFNEQIVNIKDGENLDSALKRIDEEKQALDIEMPVAAEEEAPAEAPKKAKDTDTNANES